MRAAIWAGTRAAVGRARHAHVVRRRRSRTIRSTHTRVVLRSTPAKTHAGVANGVALHLIDGHLGGVAVDELDEAAALAGRNLDVRNLAKSLEERSQFVLGNVA